MGLWKKFIFILLIFLAIIVGLGWYLAPNDPLEKSDYIIAISGGDTAARADEAIELYEDGYAPLIIFAGGALDPSSPSNAAIMKRRAERAGVPSYAVSIEEASQDTAQNANNVAMLFEGEEPPERIILVTSPYHQRRAFILFEQAFPDTEIINHPAADQTWRRSLWWVDPKGWYLTISETIKTVYVLNSNE